jgi:BolA protein
MGGEKPAGEKTGVADEIRDSLERAFAPSELTVTDESERHRGHAGYQEGGESHFRVAIRAPAFASMSRIERHRAVHAALGPDLVGRIHALALKIEG